MSRVGRPLEPLAWASTVVVELRLDWRLLTIASPPAATPDRSADPLGRHRASGRPPALRPAPPSRPATAVIAASDRFRLGPRADQPARRRRPAALPRRPHANIRQIGRILDLPGKWKHRTVTGQHRTSPPTSRAPTSATTAEPSPRYTAPRSSDRNSGAHTAQFCAQRDRSRGGATAPTTGSVPGVNDKMPNHRPTHRAILLVWRPIPNAAATRSPHPPDEQPPPAHRTPYAEPTNPSHQLDPGHARTQVGTASRRRSPPRGSRPTDDQGQPTTASPTRSSSEETHLWHPRPDGLSQDR